MENALCLLADVCRLCLNLPGEHSIFNSDCLFQDIFIFTGIKLSSDETLPQNICTNCLYKIEAMKDLKECATTNNKYITDLLNDATETRNEVLVPKTSTKIMTGIVVRREGEYPEKVKKYLTREEKQRIERKHRHIKQIEKGKHPTISVRSIRDINSQNFPDHTSDQSTRIEKSSLTRKNGVVLLKCDICQKTYTTWKKLYCHQRTHTKQLFCPLDGCGKSFATKGDLQKHIRAHTGERPYQCDLCDRSFTQNCTLKAHRKSLHGGV